MPKVLVSTDICKEQSDENDPENVEFWNSLPSQAIVSLLFGT